MWECSHHPSINYPVELNEQTRVEQQQQRRRCVNWIIQDKRLGMVTVNICFGVVSMECRLEGLFNVTKCKKDKKDRYLPSPKSGGQWGAKIRKLENIKFKMLMKSLDVLIGF